VYGTARIVHYLVGMSARAHLALRLAAIAVIAVASMVPRGGASALKAQASSVLTPVSASAALARR